MIGLVIVLQLYVDRIQYGYESTERLLYPADRSLFRFCHRRQTHGSVYERRTDVRDVRIALSPMTSLLSARKKPIRIGITSFDPTCISGERREKV